MARGTASPSPANIQQYLNGVHYPVDKERLLDQARTNSAPSEVMDTLRELPEEQYGGPQDVMKAYGRIH